MSDTKRKFDSSSSSSSSSSSAPNKFSKLSHSNKKGQYNNDKKDGNSKFNNNNNKSSSFKKPFNKSNDKSRKPVALTRKDRDALKKERKASKPNADLIAEANKLWQTSFQTMNKQERDEKITQLLKHCSGKIKEIACKHDASRALQLVLKYSNEHHKSHILQEITNMFVPLSEDHYAHYLVLKLLQYDTKKNAAKLQALQEFGGKALKLSTHSVGSKVLDYLYASSRAKHQLSMLQEFYSPEFFLLKEEKYKDKSLKEILDISPDKKESILTSLRKFLDKCVEKNMTMFRFVHALLVNYLSVASANDAKELITALYAAIPTLHHSPDGCKIITHMIASGGAKERKQILKHFKGVILNMNERAEGYAVLACALDCVDDTVLLEKTILSELLVDVGPQLLHQHSSKIYVHLLEPNNKGVFSPHSLRPHETEILNAEATDKLFKKDPAIKNQELLLHVLPALLNAIALPTQLQQMLVSNIGHHVLLATLQQAWSLAHNSQCIPNMIKLQPELKNLTKIIFSEINKLVEKSLNGELNGAVKPEQNDDEMQDDDAAAAQKPVVPSSSTPSPSTDYLADRFGQYFFKRLIQKFTPRPLDFLTQFADTLTTHLSSICTNSRSSFVLATLIEENIEGISEQLKKKLKSLKKDIEKSIAQQEVINQKADKEKSNKPQHNGHAKGDNNENKYVFASTAGQNLLLKLLSGDASKSSASSSTTSSSKPPTQPRASPKLSAATSSPTLRSASKPSPKLAPLASPKLKPAVKSEEPTDKSKSKSKKK